MFSNIIDIVQQEYVLLLCVRQVFGGREHLRMSSRFFKVRTTKKATKFQSFFWILKHGLNPDKIQQLLK